MKFVDVLPTTPGKRLHIGGEADVMKDRFPIEREGEIGEGLIAGVRRQVAGGQDDGLWHRDADAGGETVVEEFLIGAPPEGVVDDGRAAEGRILQVGPVEWDVL